MRMRHPNTAARAIKTNLAPTTTAPIVRAMRSPGSAVRHRGSLPPAGCFGDVHMAEARRAGYLLVGAVRFLAGTILVTIVFNVPRNNALAAVNPASAYSARLWTNFLRTWTAWNHVRMLAALAAATLLTMGLCAPLVK